MKIKISLFKKIFLFSIFLIIFTVLVSYILSTSVADSFYVARKKNEIVKIKDNIEKYIENSEILEEYIENIKDKEGINIYIENIEDRDERENREFHHRKTRNRYKKIENGFHVLSLQNNIILLVYKENILKNDVIITTSLSVMSSHRHEVYFLNLMTFILVLGISIIISRVFSKK